MRRLAPMLATLGLVGCSAITGGSSAPAAMPAGESRPVVDSRMLELQRQATRAEAEIRLLRRQLAALQVEVERLAAAAESAALAPSPPVESEAPVLGQPSFEATELEPVRVPAAPAAVEPEAPRAPSGEAPAPVAAENVQVPLAGQAIYDRGYTLYHQGRYVDAESSFQRFLQAHADTGLADNARYWIGESRFARRDFMGALLAYQEVLDRHPRGNKVADALLKIGDCLVELDNADGARQRYEEVVRRFPGSAAAVMAEERLGRSQR